MRDIYAEVTDRIIGKLEEGAIPWRQPWSAAPANYISRRPYRGVNVWLLDSDHTSPYWLTYRQADEVVRLRGQVRPYVSSYTTSLELEGMAELWGTIQSEYDRRYGQREKSRYSITRRGSKIAVRLSPYDQLALQKDYQLATVRSMNGRD